MRRPGIVLGVTVIAALLAACLWRPLDADVELLSAQQMSTYIGAASFPCKAQAAAGSDYDCQKCHKLAPTEESPYQSKQYSMGPIGNYCPSLSQTTKNCSPTGGKIVCGGGEWAYYQYNEDCLGIPQLHATEEYEVATASGDPC